MFIGNLFVFFKFQGLERIDEETRNMVIWVLSAIAMAGIIVFLLLPPIRPDEIDREDGVVEVPEGPLEALKSSGKLFVTKRMLLLSVTFFYTGKSSNFPCSGVSSEVL